MTGLRTRIVALRSGFLFVPGLVAAALALLAVGMVALDRSGGGNGHGLGIGFGADAVAARTLLSTIGGSLITIAGVSYSITIVSLQLVSQQFSPRALRNFLLDPINQVVAGFFIGVFVYCLLVLRSIRNASDTGTGFVPAASISLAIVLAVVALALLLVFIHHMTLSIQLSTIAARISSSTVAELDHVYPEQFGRGVAESAPELLERWRGGGPPRIVRAGRAGYVRSVDLGILRSAAGRLHISVAPGDFGTSAHPIAEAWDVLADDVEARVCKAVRISDERDIQNDVAYGLRQLSDIAQKALSPGINDPTSAIACINHMREVAERLAVRDFPSGVRRDPESDHVLVLYRRDFADHLTYFEEVARSADGEPRVAGALLDALEAVAAEAERSGAGERAETVRAAAERVAVLSSAQ